MPKITIPTPDQTTDLIEKTIATVKRLRDQTVAFINDGLSDAVLEDAEQHAHEILAWVGQISELYQLASKQVAEFKLFAASDEGQRGGLVIAMDQQLAQRGLSQIYAALTPSVTETSEQTTYGTL